MLTKTIWFWKRGYFKVYIDNLKIRQKVDRWKEAKLHCTYSFPNGQMGWDFIITTKLYNRIAELLNLPSRTKNVNRVEAGKRLQKFKNVHKFT
jgi:hypothetical protein